MTDKKINQSERQANSIIFFSSYLNQTNASPALTLSIMGNEINMTAKIIMMKKNELMNRNDTKSDCKFTHCLFFTSKSFILSHDA